MADTHSTRIPLTHALLALVVAASACADLPTAPTIQGPITLAVAGQSNARMSRPALAAHPDVRLAPVESICPTIAYWAADGQCWPALQSTLADAPVDAFMFWQGESDIDNRSYDVALADLIRRVRSATNTPRLLVVLIQYGPAYSGFSVDGKGSEAASVAFTKQDAHAIYVPTHDLQWLPDNGHMTEAGYTAVAQRVVTMIKAKLNR